MKKTFVLFFVLFFLVMTGVLDAAPGPDYRPKFDKSAYKGTLWTQVNPWWVPNKPRVLQPLGGPNYARKLYSDTPVEYWREAMRESMRYGLNGWQFELTPPANGYGYTFKTVIQAAEGLGPDFKLAVFVGLPREKDVDTKKAAEVLKRQFRIFKKEWMSHPNIFRVDGRPVISLYRPQVFSPREWKEIIDDFESEFGPAVWLMNIYYKTYTPDKAKELRDYMPYLDGVTAYANWSSGVQEKIMKVMGPIMREEFPQKIFEGPVHTTYSVHFYHGGIPTHLSQKYRHAWDTMRNTGIDSVVLTNFFDHWENSLVMPCYEREDFMLRYAEYQMSELFGKKFKAAREPELVLTNYIDIVAGHRKLEFEVIAFPTAGPCKEITFRVELCNAQGKPIYSFPDKTVDLHKLSVAKYEIESEKFIGERAVFPRLSGSFQGKSFTGMINPPTLIDPSIRTSWMFWARSTLNAITLSAPQTDWSINGVTPGGTVPWNVSGSYGFFSSPLTAKNGNPDLLRIMQNLEEFISWKQNSMKIGRVFALPYPGGALHFYHMELENAEGKRAQTLPVWVSAGTRPGKVEMPFYFSNEKIETRTIEAARVPYFHYPCDTDTGMLLLDVSGYRHHGKLQTNGTVGYAFGSLGHTGYCHLHDGPAPNIPNEHFRRDENGRGYLHFDADKKDFYMISGGTAFPYASTYEFIFRSEKFGKKMYLAGSPNNQINIFIDEDGYLIASRGSSVEGPGGEVTKKVSIREVKSKTKVEPGKWHSLAVVYDLKDLKLYLDGKLERSVAAAPVSGHESMDHLTIASKCKFLHTPGDYFDGDIREIRIYGRNLSPDEFLKEPSLQKPGEVRQN